MFRCMETLRLKKTKDKINEVTKESILLFTRQNGSSFPNVCASEVNILLLKKRDKRQNTFLPDCQVFV